MRVSSQGSAIHTSAPRLARCAACALPPCAVGDRGGDREAEPGAAARARLVGAREALERARQEVRREARALVAHVQLDARRCSRAALSATVPSP